MNQIEKATKRVLKEKEEIARFFEQGSFIITGVYPFNLACDLVRQEATQLKGMIGRSNAMDKIFVLIEEGNRVVPDLYISQPTALEQHSPYDPFNPANSQKLVRQDVFGNVVAQCRTHPESPGDGLMVSVQSRII